jgi:type I restriction enzyme, S subunit
MIPDGWKRKSLGEIADISSGSTPSRQKDKYWNGTIPWVTTGEIDYQIIKSTKERITELACKECSLKIHPSGTILMAMYGQGMTRGRIALLGINATTNQACCAIRLDSSANTKFIYFQLEHLYPEIRKLGHGGNQQNLNGQIIKQISITYPPLPEQCKIAEILGAWDDAIALLEKLIAAKRKLKQGLMQQLLTGKKRFKEFDRESSFFVSSDYFESKLSDFPDDWLKVPIGKVCRSIVPGRNKPKQFDGNIPWITTPNITQKYISTKNTNLFVSEEEIKLCGGKIVPKGAVIINCVGDFGIIGIAQQELVINQQLHAFVCPKELNSEYIFYALSIQTHHMLKVATTTTIPYMNKSSCESIPILLPPPLEQEKIASVLSAADTEISTLEKQLAAYKQQKRGLMQQLLTGKTRVRVN